MDLLGSAITMRRLTFAFIIISSFILASVLIPTTHVLAASKMPKGTEIANIDVAELTEDEIRQNLTNKITIWQTGEPLLLKSNFEKIEIPRTAFDFDIDETIVQLEAQMKGNWKSLFRKKKNVHVPLVTTMDANDFATQYLHKQTHLNTDALEIELINIAENLEEDEISLTYDDESAIPFEMIAEVEIDLSNLPDHIIERAADEIDGYTIEPESAVSYLKNLSIYSLLIDDIENTTAATGLYELFLKTNFEVVERHTSLHYDEKKETDVEAYVHQAKNKDFIIHNPNDIAFILRAEPNKETITLRLESTFDEVSFDYEVKTKKINYRTLYHYKKGLTPGYAEIIQAGQNGLDVKIEQSQYDASEILESKTTVAHDTYLPVPQIVLTSSELLEEVNETDLDDETADANLHESGETIDYIDDYYDETDEWIDNVNNDYLNDTQQVTGEERDKRIEELKENYATILDIWKEVFGDDANTESEKEMKQLEKEIKKYQKDIKSLEKEIQKLIKDSESNNDVNIDSIMKKLDAQQEQIAFLYIIIKQLELEQDEMKADLEKLKTTIENHQANLESIKHKLDKSEKDIKETLTNYEKELAELIEKVDKLLEKDEDDDKKDEGDVDAEA